jgi:hypothetical protein
VKTSRETEGLSLGLHDRTAVLGRLKDALAGARARYRTALGSAVETAACLDVAVALGYVERLDREVMAKLQHVRAVMARVVA